MIVRLYHDDGTEAFNTSVNNAGAITFWVEYIPKVVHPRAAPGQRVIKSWTVKGAILNQNPPGTPLPTGVNRAIDEVLEAYDDQ